MSLLDTEQGRRWKSGFGKEWSCRNLFTLSELDRHYEGKYGITRSELNQRFLEGIPKDASILEVGCNLGNQLVALHQAKFTNLHGIEIQGEIVKEARTRMPWARISEASALQIPFPGACFDLVFTSGVLIHIAPEDLQAAMEEIHRVARSWIWGLEYYAPVMTETPYRGHRDLMWKADYGQLFVQSFADLELVLEERLPYLQDENVDTMYLLRRKKK